MKAKLKKSPKIKVGNWVRPGCVGLSQVICLWPATKEATVVRNYGSRFGKVNYRVSISDCVFVREG